MTDVILGRGARTPFVDFGKSLRDVPLSELGSHAVRACLERNAIAGERVDHLTFGNVLPVDHDGNFISRKVALMAGLPVVGFATAEMATVIENGVSGYTATGLQPLLAHMHTLLDDPGLARHLGEGARRTARDRFSIGRFSSDWDAALRHVTGLGPARQEQA